MESHLTSYDTLLIEKPFFDFLQSFSELQAQQIILAIGIGLAIIASIIAFFRTKAGTMVAIAGWKDFGFLVATSVGGMLAFLATTSFVAEELPLEVRQIAFVVCLIVSVVCLFWSFYLSVVANKGNIFNIVISILAKLVILCLLWLVALLIFLFFTKSSNKIKGKKR